MARPKKPEELRMKHVIPVRLNDIQYSVIAEYAARAGTSMTDYIRKQAVQGKVKTEYQIVADFPEIQKLTRELSAIGNNLNQIARYLNTGGALSRSIRDAINAAITQIMEIRNAALELAGEFNGHTKAYRK